MTEPWLLKLKINLLIIRDLVIIILHEFMFDPSELLVDYSMCELVIFRKLKWSIDEILDLTFVYRRYRTSTEITKG